MCKKIISIVLFTVGGFLLVSGQDKAQVTFFSEDGEPFYVYFNTIQRNQQPYSKVKLTNIDEGTYQVRVEFEKDNILSVERAIHLKAGRKSEYKLIKRREAKDKKGKGKSGNKGHKAKYTLKFVSMTPIDDEGDDYTDKGDDDDEDNGGGQGHGYDDGGDDDNGHRHGDDNEHDHDDEGTHTDNDEDNDDQHASSDQNDQHYDHDHSEDCSHPSHSSGGQQTHQQSKSISISIEMGYGGSGHGHTSHEEEQTDEPHTHEHEHGHHHEQEEEEKVYVPGYNGAVGCTPPMADSDFRDAKSSISDKSFENTKLQVAKQVTKANCLLASQVEEMMREFTFENTRLEFAQFAYDHTYDIDNYYKVNDAFEFESSIDELNEYIH